MAFYCAGGWRGQVPGNRIADRWEGPALPDDLPREPVQGECQDRTKKPQASEEQRGPGVPCQPAVETILVSRAHGTQHPSASMAALAAGGTCAGRVGQGTGGALG